MFCSSSRSLVCAACWTEPAGVDERQKEVGCRNEGVCVRVVCVVTDERPTRASRKHKERSLDKPVKTARHVG